MTLTVGEALLTAVALKKAQMAADGWAPQSIDWGALQRREDAHREDLDERPRLRLEPESPSSSGVHFGLPVEGRVRSGFGERVHPVHGGRRMHRGVDIAAPAGTPIAAPAAGRVIAAGWRGGYGLAVLVDHGNGYTTLYGHMSAIAVGVGDQIAAGATLGRVGRTGTATGNHVHFETRRNGVAVDPLGH